MKVLIQACEPVMDQQFSDKTYYFHFEFEKWKVFFSNNKNKQTHKWYTEFLFSPCGDFQNI